MGAAVHLWWFTSPTYFCPFLSFLLTFGYSTWWNIKFTYDFCRFCVVLRFFQPHHNGQLPPTSKDFYTRSYPLYYFLILIHEKEPVVPFSVLSAKQENYWYHFYNVLARSLTGDWTRDLSTRLSRRRYTPIYKLSSCNRNSNGRINISENFQILNSC